MLELKRNLTFVFLQGEALDLFVDLRKMCGIQVYYPLVIINNYSPKWRWLVVDIYRATKRRGKYPPLATDTEVNNCFSIYLTIRL